MIVSALTVLPTLALTTTAIAADGPEARAPEEPGGYTRPDDDSGGYTRPDSDGQDDVDIDVTEVDIYTVEPEAGFGDDDLLVNNEADHLVTSAGVAIMAGGGGMTRVRPGVGESNATAGGQWNLRTVVGTRSVLAAEAAYVGSAQPTDDRVAGLADDAVLMSNGGEAAARVQLPVELNRANDAILAPFATAGFGLMSNAILNPGPDATADIEEAVQDSDGSDLTAHIPVGAGVAFADEGFIIDTRVNFSPAINDSDVFEREPAFDNAVDTLSVSGNIGVEF